METIIVCNACGAEFDEAHWFGSTASGCPQCGSNDVYVIGEGQLLDGQPRYYDARIPEGENLPARPQERAH